MSRPRFVRWFTAFRSPRPSDTPPANQPSVRSNLSCFEALEDRTTPAVIVPVAHSGTNFAQSSPAITNASAGDPYPASNYQQNPVLGSPVNVSTSTNVTTTYGTAVSPPVNLSTAADQAFLSLAAQNELLSFVLSTAAAQQGSTASVRQGAQQAAALDVQLLGGMVSLMTPSNTSALTGEFAQAMQMFAATGARSAAGDQQFLAANAQLQLMNSLLFQSEATSNSGSIVQAFAASRLPEVQFQFQSALQAENRGARTATSSLTSALTSATSPLNALVGSVGTMNLPTTAATATTTTTDGKPAPTHTPAFPSSGTSTTATSTSTSASTGSGTATATGTGTGTASGTGTSTATGTASGTGTGTATGTGSTTTPSGTGTGTTGSSTTTGSKTDPTHTPA